MRVVLDTNVVVSGLLWGGLPRRILDAAYIGQVTLYTSKSLVDELDTVLQRPKFADHLTRVGVTREVLTSGYVNLAHQIVPATSPHVIHDDPDDDEVLACAIAADAEVLVSGDRHLLSLRQYGKFPIISVSEFWNRLSDKTDR